MTDTTNETFSDAEVQADDARYAEMEAQHSGRGDDDQAASAEQQGGQEEREHRRPDLPPEELEKRWKNTSSALKEARQLLRKAEAERDRLAAERQNPQDEEDAIESLIGKLRDDDEDPIEDIQALKQVLREFKSQQKAERARTAETKQRDSEAQRHFNMVASLEQEFRDEQPDYDDAQVFFRNSLVEELKEEGLEGDELQQRLARDLIGLTQRAISSGKNPAEIVYKLAARRGFNGQKLAPAQQKQEKTLQVAQDAVDKAQEKLQTLEKGQKAGRSLSAVGGKSGDGTMTLSRASNMSGKDVVKAYDELKQQAKSNGTYR